MAKFKITRRAFLAATTSTLAIAAKSSKPNTARVVPRKISPNEKLNIAAIGAGGKGNTDINQCRKENVVALADPDWDRAAKTFSQFPNAKRYRDYRKMLDEMPEIDALTISTPDHSHAPAAYRAMKMGKHVYVQKPLTHTVAEARLLTNVARETGVATQMGNQGHSAGGVRNLCEMVWAGVAGPIREAHIWTSRPSWPQGITQPLPAQAVPHTLDWDLWTGPAATRPYNRGYAPHVWRGWYDFGGGALGDMACHIMDSAFWALKLLDAPYYTVEVIEEEGHNDYTYPNSTIIKYTFPQRGDMVPVDVYWYDGKFSPPRPEGVPQGQLIGDGGNGSYYVGDDGILTSGEYGTNSRLLPDERMADFTRPKRTLERIKGGHYKNWIQACKGGKPACSNFDYSGPFTEMVLFGNLAIKSGRKLEWDNKRGIVKNVDSPKEFVSKQYRPGWDLPI